MPATKEGTYTGHLTIASCADAGCTKTFPGYVASVPFTVTVTPPVRLAVTVNGTATPGNPVTVRSGDQVTVTANMPVIWNPGADIYGVTGTFMAGIAPAWTTTIFGNGTYVLTARSTDSAAGAELRINVQP